MKIVRFGHMIEDSRGTIVCYLVGAAVKEIGLGTIRQIVLLINVEPDVLQHHIELLESYREAEGALANALRAEYMCSMGGIDDAVGPSGQATSFFYKPDETKRMLGTPLRRLIKEIPKPYAEMNTSGLEPEKRSFVGLLVSGNFVGQSLVNILLPSMKPILARKCLQNTSVSATQILLALKSHKLKASSLPESLDDLVPEYFEKIPLDGFNGKPMKYSRQKKIIWSVGEDLVDVGGATDQSLQNTEPTFKIEF